MSKQMVCVWHEQDDLGGGFWQTDCDHAFQFTEGGTPAFNDFAFCPYCGKVLIGIELVDEIGE